MRSWCVVISWRRVSPGIDGVGPGSGLGPASRFVGRLSYWDADGEDESDALAEGEGLTLEPELGVEPDPLSEEPLPLDDDDEDDDEDLDGVSACWNA